MLLALACVVPSLLDGPTDREVFVDRIAALLATVEAEHVHPPPARDLLAAGVRNLQLDVDVGGTDLRAVLARVYDAASSPEILNEVAAGISRSIPGGATTVDADTARVDDSLDGNRYVGVGVVLDMHGDRPRIQDTYFGGPAHRAGIRPGDIIYEVEGVDTLDMGVAGFIAYSRGEIGTEFTYVVGQPGEERRTVRLTRSVVPRETVVGTERGEDERWRHELDGSRIAYVKLTGITASTAHELRKARERIEPDAPVVLDLRGCRSTHMHATALVADLFRTDGLLGASETRHRRTEYRATPDALFDASEVAVLVDASTRGTPEWLAKVLARGGAVTIGEPTGGVPFLPGRVSVPGWPVEVRLSTGWILEPEEDAPLRRVEPERETEDALRAAREVLER